MKFRIKEVVFESGKIRFFPEVYIEYPEGSSLKNAEGWSSILSDYNEKGYKTKKKALKYIKDYKNDVLNQNIKSEIIHNIK